MIKSIKEAIKDPVGTIKRIYRWLELFDERLERHHTFMLASGIAFNILLYLLPVFLILVLTIRLMFGEQGILKAIQDVILEFLPPTENTYSLINLLSEEVEKLVEFASVFGIISGVMLLWLSSILISSFRSALNTIFNLKSRHIFILYRFKDMFLILVLTFLILLYSYIVPFINQIIDLISSSSPEIFTGFISTALSSLLSLVTSFLLIYFIYRWVPNQRIPRKPRIFATVTTVLMIEVSRHLFAWYISSVSNYGKFYGTYAVVVSIAIWVYYSSLIILLSAELGKYIYDNKWNKKHLSEDIVEDNLPI